MIFLSALVLTTVTVDSSIAYASSAPTLGEIGNTEKEQSKGSTSSSGTTSSGRKSSSKFIDDLSDAADLGEPSAEATKIGGTIRKWASMIVQVLSYIITAGLVVRIALDLIYIGLPFFRSILANGYMGNPNVEGRPNAAQGGMGMGGMGMGGMGMGGMGMGGMGMGGMRGMGGMGGMGMQNAMGNQMSMQNQPSTGRIQFVSNAALNAVATESVQGPDGKGNNAFKVYSKDMIVLLVVTPILLVLAVTGVLSDVGFMIGSWIESLLRGISL